MDILPNRGAQLEGDIFSVLSHSPWVIRSFEFARADGAIDCARACSPTTSYADRFWRLEQSATNKLLLFDVKGSVALVAGKQVFVTTIRQRRAVAFYVCICTGDPTLVELIPNRYQCVTSEEEDDKEADEDDGREVAVNTFRTSRLPFSAYRLDPSGSPYRMPLALLPEAISRVRRCAQGHGAYVNPWTLVSFDDWLPSTTQSTTHLKPAEQTEHFSAYLAVMEIYRQMTTRIISPAMRLDFVGVQPRLADFKLVVQNAPSAMPKQYFVQHKLDARERAFTTPLTKVFIGRNKENGGISWYFTPEERFDYLFYEFQFSVDAGRSRRTDFFFLPESVIPNDFYTSEQLEASFEVPEFEQYRIHMDRQGRWIQKIYDIINQNPHPRQLTQRPRRTSSLASAKSGKTKIQSKQRDAKQGGDDKAHGLRDYSATITRCHRRFFYNLMTYCAERRCGLVITLSQHPLGDFGFCRYTWTEEESHIFLKYGRPPATTDSLPPGTPIVPLYYFTRDIEMTFLGPQMLSSEFRRLNSSTVGRLILYDLSGSDGDEAETQLFAIPSHDIGFAPSQLDSLYRNLNLDKNQVFAERTPFISHVLTSGLTMSDYSIELGGPMALYRNVWSLLWSLLDSLTKTAVVEHPLNHKRSSEDYRHQLSLLHTTLYKEDICGDSGVTLKRKAIS